MGRVLHLEGEYAAARAELERALALAPDVPVDRAVGVWIRGRVLTNLAITTAALGDASSAHRALGEVVAAPSGDRMNRTRALEHLGRLEESWGDLEAALARYEEALATGEAALREDAPVPYNRAYLVGALSRVGLLRQRLGRTAAAVEALDRALATARELGTRQLVADVLLDRGILARESGDLHAALASHEEALALAAEARLEVAARPRPRRAGLGPARRRRPGGRARALRAGPRLEGRPGVAGDRGRAALGDRAGPRAPRGDGPRRRAGRPGGGRDRVRAPGNALRGAPPGLLARAPGGLPQRDRPAAPAAGRLGERPPRGAGPRARRAGALEDPARPRQPGRRPGRLGGGRARLDGRAPARGAPGGRRGRRRLRPRRAAVLGVGPDPRRLRDGRPAGPGGGRARGAGLATSHRIGRSLRPGGTGRGVSAPRAAASPRSRPRSPPCAAS